MHRGVKKRLQRLFSALVRGCLRVKRKTLSPLVFVVSLALAGCVSTEEPATSKHKISDETFAAALEITLVRKVPTAQITKKVQVYRMTREVEGVSSSEFGRPHQTADLSCIIDAMLSISPKMEIVPASQFWERLAERKEEISLRELLAPFHAPLVEELHVDFLVAAFHQEFDVGAMGAEFFLDGVYADRDREVAAEAIIDLENKKVLNASQFVFEDQLVVGHLLVVIPVVGWTRASSDLCAMAGEAAATAISNETLKPSPRVLVLAAKRNPYSVATERGDHAARAALFECVNDPAACEGVDLDMLYFKAHEGGPVKGWSLYCLGAHLGHPKARNTLGNYYRGGAEPVGKNLVKAFVWYSLAEMDGDSWAGTNREGIEREMTSAQLAEAKSLLLEWKANPAVCELETQAAN